jgi:hypothetical protein
MRRGRFIFIAVLALAAASAQAANAAAPMTVLSADFSKAADQANWMVNGAAAFTNGRLELTNDTGQDGTAFPMTPIAPISDYLATFQFEVQSLSGAAPADGFVFCEQIHGPDADSGHGGGLLGYAGADSGPFIGYTYGFEVNTYSGQGVQGVAFDAFGGRPKINQMRWPDAGGKLVDRGVYTMQVRVTPDKGAMVTVSGGKNNLPPTVAWTSPPFLDSFFSAPTDKPMFFGFTAGTGGLGTVQDILNLTIQSPAPAPAAGQ